VAFLRQLADLAHQRLIAGIESHEMTARFCELLTMESSNSGHFSGVIAAL
jgi:hypothetical protein